MGNQDAIRRQYIIGRICMYIYIRYYIRNIDIYICIYIVLVTYCMLLVLIAHAYLYCNGHGYFWGDVDVPA